MWSTYFSAQFVIFSYTISHGLLLPSYQGEVGLFGISLTIFRIMVKKHIFLLWYLWNVTSVWKVHFGWFSKFMYMYCKTKHECSHITCLLTHITKKWDKQNNTINKTIPSEAHSQMFLASSTDWNLILGLFGIFFPWTNILDLVGSVTCHKN